MPRGRPKKAKVDPEAAITSHDNLARAPLTDEQFQALAANHVAGYERFLAAKKLADANFKNQCKLAKAEGVSLALIKKCIDAKTEEGQARIREEAALIERVARWYEFATQADMFEPGDTPPTNRSYRLGKEAGMRGEKADVPTNCDHQGYMDGYHAGQTALLANVKELQPVGDDEFDA